MSKKIILGIIFSLSVISLLFYFLNKKSKVEIQFVDECNFKIFNDTLFKNSYLYDSYGYIISDSKLESIGIEISSNNKLNKEDDYIFTIYHPIKDIEEIDDGINHKNKIALKVTLDSLKTTKKIYVYQLKQKNRYRLMLP